MSTDLGVTVEDVWDRWIDPDDDISDAQIDVLLADAEDMAIREFPDLPQRVESGHTPHRRVIAVIAGIVIRVLRNPDGVRSVTDSTGPYSGSTTYAGDAPGQMHLSDADRRALSGETKRGGRAFSVRPSGMRI